MTMPPFIDIASLSENQRITIIGRSVMEMPSSSADKPPVAGFVVEDDVKADRYIRKLQKEFPTIRIIKRVPNCPTPGMVTVQVGPPLR